jgi:hypothetical protein
LGACRVAWGCCGLPLDFEPKNKEEMKKMSSENEISELYQRVKSLVASHVDISLRDCSDYHGRMFSVGFEDHNNRYHWVAFNSRISLKNALEKAIDKLEHPEKDYVDHDGTVWESSSTSSCYGTDHVKTFLATLR